MSGSSNFQQWNPTSANQESDSSYTSDTQRSGGAANPSIFASATANKLFYQLSTFVTAFSVMLANKNYTVSDANLATLEAVLANVMTVADMSAYALLAGPQLTGVPTAPTPAQGATTNQIANAYWVSTYFATLTYLQATCAPLLNAALTGTPTAPTPVSTDNSTRLATTAFIKTCLASYQAALGFTPVQQGGGAGQATNKVYLGWDGTKPKLQIDSTDMGGLALQSWVTALGYAPETYCNSTFATIAQLANYEPTSNFGLANPSGSAAYFRMPNGMIIQFGQAGVGTATVITLPATYTTGFYQVTLTNIGPGGGTMNFRQLGSANVNASSFKVWAYDQTGAASSTNVSWIAIGY